MPNNDQQIIDGPLGRHTRKWYRVHQMQPPTPGSGGGTGPWDPGTVGTGAGGPGQNVPGGGIGTTPGAGNATPNAPAFVPPPPPPPPPTPPAQTPAQLFAIQQAADRKKWMDVWWKENGPWRSTGRQDMPPGDQDSFSPTTGFGHPAPASPAYTATHYEPGDGGEPGSRLPNAPPINALAPPLPPVAPPAAPPNPLAALVGPVGPTGPGGPAVPAVTPEIPLGNAPTAPKSWQDAPNWGNATWGHGMSPDAATKSAAPQSWGQPAAQTAQTAGVWGHPGAWGQEPAQPRQRSGVWGQQPAQGTTQGPQGWTGLGSTGGQRDPKKYGQAWVR